jgi:hypothetical protein
MTQLVLQPCSLGTSMQHFEDTVLRPVLLDEHEDSVGDNLIALRRVASDGYLALWGILPNSKLASYRRLQVGDRALFVCDGRGFYTGEVLATFRSPVLAERLWGRDEQGSTWEYMYALGHDGPVDVDGVELNRAIRYKEHAKIRQFTVLPAERSASALDLINRSLRARQVAPLVINPPRRGQRAGLRSLTDPQAVIKAIGEYDAVGQEAFLAKYGFGPARSFFLTWNAKEYDSNAIAGAACAYQPGVGRALSAAEFSGGETGAVARLRALGFTVRSGPAAAPGRQITRASVLEAVGEWDRIGRETFLAKYRAAAAQRYVVVENGSEYDAKPLVQAAWALENADQPPLEGRDFRGDRRRIAEPLRHLGFWVVRTDQPSTPEDPPLGHDPQRYLDAAAALQGPLDKSTRTTARQEQDLVRGALGLFVDAASKCGLCARTFPNRLLVAAHIKKRAECTDEERIDVLNVAMPACVLGCDALFERGYVGVDSTGRLVAAERAMSIPAVADTLARFAGRETPAWSPSREPYFAWHRLKTFLG